MPIPMPLSGILSHLRCKIPHRPTGDAFVFLHVIAIHQLEASVRPHGLAAVTETSEAEID